MVTFRFRIAGLVAFTPLMLGLGVVGAPASASADGGTSCSDAGATGLTAALVASPGQRIGPDTIDAAGCDIGIYIGPGVTGVRVNGVTVSGANDHGIFAQDTSNLVIENSTVEGNGVAPHAVRSDKAVQLAGTSNSIVRDNVVKGNFSGGIDITDDGAIDPGALNPGTLMAARNDLIMGNQISGNFGECGLVVSAYNKGAGVSDNTLIRNTVTGRTGVFSAQGPVIGAIVVAADTPWTSALDNSVVGNTVTGSFLAGIIVHSNAPGDLVSGTVVSSNVVSSNGWGKTDGPPVRVGVILATRAATAALTHSTVAANRITDEDYGIWISAAADTALGGLPLDRADTPVVRAP